MGYAQRINKALQDGMLNNAVVIFWKAVPPSLKGEADKDGSTVHACNKWSMDSTSGCMVIQLEKEGSDTLMQVPKENYHYILISKAEVVN